MKKILSRSQTSIYMIPIYIIVFIIYHFAKDPILKYLAVTPQKSLMPKEWYTFLTYSFIHDGFFHLIGNSLRLLFVGLIVEPRIPKFQFRILFAASIIVGGIFYCIISDIHAPLIGTGFLLASLGGALIATWIKSKKDFNSLENIYTLLGIILTSISLVITIILVPFGKVEGSPIMYTRLFLFALGFCFIIVLSKFYKIELKEECNKTD